MNFLVTGANGFIGAHLCKYLIDSGEKVYAMVRKTSNLSLLNDFIPNLEGLTLVYGDINQPDSLNEAFKDMDVIINLAGKVSGISQEDFDRVNVDGYLNVCEAVLNVNPNLKRLIMTSSMAAEGPSNKDEILTEEEPYRFLKNDLYGISKHKMEEEIKPYMEKLPQTSIVRPPIVLGAGDTPSLDLYRLPKKGFKLVMGRKPRDYSIVDVRDLCKGIYLMAQRDEANGQIFYFTTGEPVEWGVLQDIIGKEAFEREKRLRNIAMPTFLALTIGKMMSFIGKIRKKPPFLSTTKMVEAIAPGWCFSSEKAKKLLGYKPEQTIESTVKDAVKWYEEHGLL